MIQDITVMIAGRAGDGVLFDQLRNKVKQLDEDSSYDPGNRTQAREVLDKEGKIPIGLIYKERKPPFESLVYKDERRPLVLEDLKIDSSKLEKMLDEFD